MATSSINPNVVQTELDRVVFNVFSPEKKPGYASVENSKIFNQIPVKLGVQKEEIFAGSGYWEQRGEKQNVPRGESRVGQTVTYTIVEFSKAEDFPKWYFDDSQFDVVVKAVRQMAYSGRRTQMREAFGLWRNAFSSTGTLTSDGLSLINNSHTLLNSNRTVDNYLTDKLTDGTLNDLINLMAEMYTQDGVLAGYLLECLLGSNRRFKDMCELVDSELSAETANNAVNVYSSKYNIFVYQSEMIGAAAGGSDHYVFGLAGYHEVNRYIREKLNTWSRSWELSDNRTYTYGAAYRELYRAPDFAGVVGTDGTTGAYA